MTRLCRRWPPAVVLTGAWLALCASLSCAQAGSGSPGEVLRADRRLARPITLAGRQVYLGELLEHVSRETGVAIGTNSRLGDFSGYEMTVRVQERPAWDLLEAVRRLYDAPPDRWYWQPVGSSDQRRYVLRRTRTSAQVAQANEAFQQRFLEDQFEATRQFYALDPAEREKAAVGSAHLSVLRSGGRSEGLFSILQSVNPMSRAAAIRGERVRIPVSSLSESQRALITRYYADSGLLGRPGVVQPGEVENLELRRHKETLYLTIGATGSHGVLGGSWLDAALLDRSRAMWPGDRPEGEPPDGQSPAPGSPVSSEQLAMGPAPRDALVLRFARLAHFDLLYDRPPLIHTGSYRGRGTLAGRITDVLDRMQPGAVLWTYYRGLVLARDPGWELQSREPAIPWELMRRIEASAGERDGFVSPSLWPELARLSRDQLEGLSRRLQDAGLILAHQPVFLLYAAMRPAERSRAATEHWIGWTEMSGATRERLSALLAPAEATAARVVVRFSSGLKPPTVTLYLGPARPVLPAVTIELHRLKTREEALAAG